MKEEQQPQVSGEGRTLNYLLFLLQHYGSYPRKPGEATTLMGVDRKGYVSLKGECHVRPMPVLSHPTWGH